MNKGLATFIILVAIVGVGWYCYSKYRELNPTPTQPPPGTGLVR